MSESNRLNDSTDWIKLDFVERKRTPHEIIETGIQPILLSYHFRILNSILRGWVSIGVEQPFTTGFKRLSTAS